MLPFTYTARNASGQEESGEVLAADVAEAWRLLKERGLTPLKISEVERLRRSLSRWPVTTQDKVMLFRQLALMLRSGLSLAFVLETLEAEAHKIKMRDVLARLRDDIRAGRPFSEALERQPEIFPPLICRLVSSSEASGQLADACVAIAENLEFWRELRGKVLAAALYPAIVLLLGLGVLLFLLISLVPKFEKAFGAKLSVVPWMAKSLFTLSHLVLSWWPLILTALCLAPFAVWICLKVARIRGGLLDAALRLPLLGPLLVVAAVTRAGHSLALLLGAGVPLIDSLRLTASLMQVPQLALAFSRGAERVLNGYSLRDALQSSHLPPTFYGMVAVGEQSGSLPAVMKELGTFYQGELDRRVQVLSRMLEPALLIVIGGMVGYVYLAFFQCVVALNKR
ncbi:MAG: hypothetical protein RL095_3001 [Verrucomicrobiota bacterium]|jgi:type IV pilus assembly protein PilC